MSTRIVGAMLLGAGFAVSVAAAQTPVGAGITYQGRLLEAGEPADGTYDLLFELYDAYVGGTIVAGPLAVNDWPVEAGLFTVSLDFGSTAYNGQARWLEIAVRPGGSGGGYTTLAPRQELTAAPYALYALSSPGGGATNADTVDGFHAAAVPTPNTLLALDGSAKFPNSVLYTGSGNNLDACRLDGQHGTFYQDATNLTAGTLPNARLAGTYSSVLGLTNAGNSFTGNGAGLTGLNATNLASGTVPDARLSGNVALLAGTQTFSGAKTFSAAPSFTAGGAPFTVASSSAVTNLNADLLDGQHASFYQNAGNLISGTLLDARLSPNVDLLNLAQTITATKAFTNWVGIGTTSPAARLDVRGGDLWLDSSTGALQVGYPTGSAWRVTTTGGGDTLVFMSGTAGGSFNTQVAFQSNGYVGIGTVAPATPLEVIASYSGSDGALTVTDTAPNNDTPAIYGEHAVTDYWGVGVKGVGGYMGVQGLVSPTGSSSYYGVYGYVTGGSGTNRAVYGYAGGTANSYGGYFESSGVGLYASGGSGQPAAIFRGNVRVQNSGGATIVELGEGLDYAEGFDVSAPAEIGPGCVLIIDPASPGKLKLSSEAYDRKVAGIVAGASGLGSGVRLGTDKFDHDVALAGRVYCKVDGRFGAIAPGDLLTTSPTPGHAMKVTDHARAQGAILGKAMESLAEGERGEILVLVTLQ